MPAAKKCTFLFYLTIASYLTSSVCNSKVVISEIQLSDTQYTENSFIELYNTSDTTENLSGYVIKKRSTTGTETIIISIPPGKYIPAKGFFLWANNLHNYHLQVNADVNSSITLSGNESVALCNTQGVIVDAVAFGDKTQLCPFVEGTNYPYNPPPGYSIERKAYKDSTAITMFPGGEHEFAGNGYDSEDNSQDFILQIKPNPQNTQSPQEPDISPPTIPQLLSPQNNSSTEDSTPLFDWTDATDNNNDSSSVSYEIQIDDNLDFSSPEIYQRGLRNSQFEPSTPLSRNNTYYWRVRAKDKAGNFSSWSNTWKITIVPAIIRIGLIMDLGSTSTYRGNKTSLTISGNGKFAIVNVPTAQQIATGNNGEVWQLNASGGMIEILNPQKQSVGNYEGPIKITPLNNNTILEIGTPATSRKRYRGEFEIKYDGGYLTAINLVDKEEYLYSVVGAEMSPDWPVEALKAQAVCARTYRDAVWNKHSAMGYNLCDTTHCQVYRGISTEGANTITAVNNTTGVVARYQSSLPTLYFFASCGGYTANNEDVWTEGTPLQYLRSVSDKDTSSMEDFCSQALSGNTNYTWSAVLTRSSLETLLKNNSSTKPSNSSARLINVRRNTIDVSGRAKYVDIVYNTETKTVSGATFRTVVGATTIKSTLWTSNPVYNSSNDTFTFYGKGYGHGVGLCQYGAKGRALSGYTYREILSHYYKGITITEPPGDSMPPPAPQLLKPSNSSTVNLRRPLIFYWEDVYDPSGVSYALQISKDENFSTTILDVSGITAPVYELTNKTLLNDGNYWWRVRATDTAGNKSSWAQPYKLTVDSTPPAKPLNLLATLGNDKIHLSWEPNTENDLYGYNIYRSSKEISNYIFIAFVPKPYSYYEEDIQNLATQITYYYRITAVDTADNESTLSNIASITLSSGNYKDTIPPGRIEDLSIKEYDLINNKVLLTWTSTGDDGNNGDIINGKYRIDYSTYLKNFSYTEYKIEFATNTKANSRNYYYCRNVFQQNLTQEMTYYFVIYLCDEAENFSPPSNIATLFVKQIVVPPTPPKDKVVNGKIVTFNNSISFSSNIKKVKIYNLRNTEITNLEKSSNDNNIIWDGTNDKGEKVAPGCYLYLAEDDNKKYSGVIVVAW
jgi:stage II sporulation protein D